VTPAWPDRYACVDLDGLALGPYRLRPIAWSDRVPIRRWRNERLEILRQAQPLTEEDQDRYFRAVVAPQLDQARPDQVLVAFLLADRLIGYGGLVHLDWAGATGEVSFITEAERQSAEEFSADLGAFFALIRAVALRLGLTRITTEVYAFREDYIAEAERAGFVLAERLAGHVRHGDDLVDSLVYELRLDA
jgi:RimJ/RimL family protein N-acetyltransferase